MKDNCLWFPAYGSLLMVPGNLCQDWPSIYSVLPHELQSNQNFCKSDRSQVLLQLLQAIKTWLANRSIEAYK
jgi:hypothetical protein